jgi:predicted dienelactone hydrolase
LAGSAANLANRPRHVRLVLDAVFGDEQLGKRVSAAGAGVIGHSLGGYTALALAGGRPTCFAHESPDGQPHTVPVVPDPRIRALVLLAPATPWLMADGALAEVTVPILMRTGERDDHAPAFHAAIVLHGVADRARVDHRVVPNAGHFSFQSPFPPAMTRPEFPPSQDPPGFDRAAFQPLLHAEVLAFLRAELGAAALGLAALGAAALAR